MSFLENLPVHNPLNFSSHKKKFKDVEIRKTFGQGRNYIPTHQSNIPDPDQVIKTDQTNLLIRFRNIQPQNDKRKKRSTGDMDEHDSLSGSEVKKIKRQSLSQQSI